MEIHFLNLKSLKGELSLNSVFGGFSIEVELEAWELEGFKFYTSLLILEGLQFFSSINGKLSIVESVNELKGKTFYFGNQDYFGGLYSNHLFFIEGLEETQIQIEETYDCVIEVANIEFKELGNNSIASKLKLKVDFSLFRVREFPFKKKYPRFDMFLEVPLFVV